MKKIFRTSFLFFALSLSFGCTHEQKADQKPVEFVKGVFGRTCEPSAEGTMREGYANNLTTGDRPCPTAFQTCVAGKWVGAPLFDRCENYTKNCGTTAHGSSEIGFLTALGTPLNPCVRGTRTCLNGQWSGPEVYPTCFEADGP